LIGPDGSVVSILSNDTDAFRLARALAITGVPKSRRSWTLVQEAGTQPEVPSSKTVFTYEGLEALGNRQASKIQFDFRENLPQGEPLQAKGRYWLEVGTGRLLLLEAEMTGLPGISGPDARAKVTVRSAED
jgi:hypothetical protein